MTMTATEKKELVGRIDALKSELTVSSSEKLEKQKENDQLKE